MAPHSHQGSMPAGEEDLIIDTTGGEAAAVPVLHEDGAAPELPPGAVRQEDGSVVFALQYPCAITYRRQSDGAKREEELKQLHLHRLTGADMRAITAASQEKMTAVALARSARMNEAKMALFFDRMDGADAAAAMEIVSGFLGTGRKTGR